MPQLWQKTRNGVQSCLYWLGPTYCILVGALILFGSFIVQLLTSIGVPYIKSFDFYRFDFQDRSFVELGMWAACSGRAAIYFPTRPDLPVTPEAFNCPPAKWGWNQAQFSGITDNFFHHTLPKALIFHPIACCFTFFAMVAALVTIKRKRSHIALPIFSFFSCLFAMVSFIIDLATFVPARRKLMSDYGTMTLGLIVISTEYGPAFWLSLTTFCLDIIGNSIIIFGYSIWRYQRKSRADRRVGGYSDDVEGRGTEMKTRRGYAAQGSIASFGDVAATSSASNRSSKGRRGMEDDDEGDQETFHDDKDTVETGEERQAAATPRLSNDARSMTNRSLAPTQYEDADDDDDEDGDGQSARSIYEDAPANIGSRGFTKRKPVEQY